MAAAPRLRLVIALLSLFRWSLAKELLFLPLKTQAVRHSSKLSFHHNISLTVSVTVGAPAQTVTMVLDTGSELSWLRCGQSGSKFEPSRSSSYAPVKCESPVCKAKTRDLTIPATCDGKKREFCHVAISYADASSMEGTLSEDSFVIGGSKKNMLFGCMDSGWSSNEEEDSKTTGLIGLNRGSLSLVNQMGFPKFAYCISDRDAAGVLLFGEASLGWLRPLNYTPLVNISTPLPYFDRVAYTVRLNRIQVGGLSVRIPDSVLRPDHTGAGQTMVDSGTQFSFLLGPAYTSLRDAFSKRANRILKPLGEPNFVFQLAMDLCYRSSSPAYFSRLPAVTLVFDGAEMSVSGERLMYQVPGERRGSDSVYCFTFGNSDLLGIEAFLIGHHHQQNKWVEFDLTNSRVGFAEVRCDLAGQKLGMNL